jgi:hydrogenase maturation protease
MRRVLIIGYGNILRSDDAAGVHAAHRLEESFRDDPEVRVIAAHQLASELSEDIAEATYVLFLKAAAGKTPGAIFETQLAPGGVLGALGENVTPGALLFCAEQLYGEAPAAFSLTITGASFEAGTAVSPAIAEPMEEFVRRAHALVQSWLGEKTAEAVGWVPTGSDLGGTAGRE